MYNTIWLFNSTLYLYFISSNHRFFYRKKHWCQGITHWSSVFSYDTTSTNHCGRTYFWWFCTLDPHLWFVHLPNWHFSLHLTTLQRPAICKVDNFQRFRFISIPISSQKKYNQEPTFTFTFTLHTIYKVNGTAWYLEKCWLATDNDAILTLYLIHTLSLTIYVFYMSSNQ